MDSVGERIKQIRISKGITQAELADAIGTTKVAISRYELNKRELRFEQAQNIANSLGVSVFELYGLSAQKERQLEKLRATIANIREVLRREADKNQDGSLLKSPQDFEGWQSTADELEKTADELEKDLQTVLKIVTHEHNRQVRLQADDEDEMPEKLPQANPEIKPKNKRIDNLISMFTAYPYDVQTRILDIVATFGQLNSVGQKHAVGRTKELAEIPRYQVQQENDDET